MRVAFEINLAHCTFDAFSHSENDPRCSAFLVDWIHSKFNADVIESVPLIDFDDFLPRFLECLFVNRLVQSHFDFFAQSFWFHPFCTVDFDLA